MGAEILHVRCHVLPSVVSAATSGAGEDSSIHSQFSAIEFQRRLPLFEYIRTECTVVYLRVLLMTRFSLSLVENGSIHAETAGHRVHSRWGFHRRKCADLQRLCLGTAKRGCRYVQLPTWPVG